MRFCIPLSWIKDDCSTPGHLYLLPTRPRTGNVFGFGGGSTDLCRRMEELCFAVETAWCTEWKTCNAHVLIPGRKPQSKTSELSTSTRGGCISVFCVYGGLSPKHAELLRDTSRPLTRAKLGLTLVGADGSPRWPQTGPCSCRASAFPSGARPHSSPDLRHPGPGSSPWISGRWLPASVCCLFTLFSSLSWIFMWSSKIAKSTLIRGLSAT